MKTETTNYEQQAQAFLDRFGIKFRCTLSDSKVAPWGDESKGQRHHYRVTLSKDEQTEAVYANFLGRHQRKPARITFDFFGSITNAEKLAEFKRTTPPAFYPAGQPEKMPGHPTVYDVLVCISGDTYCAETFADWCSEFGESEDSINALQTFRRCSAFSKRLNQFFTAEEIEALREIQ